MSFFGLTHLGFQNSLREYSKAAKEDPYRGSRQFDYTALPPLKDKNPPTRSVVPVDQVSGYGSGHEDSYVELTRMRFKHLRNPRPPTYFYFHPPTTSLEVGWWNKDSPLSVSRPWTHVQRKPQIYSEMTRFVDTMALTNKDFKLF
ncbi:testis-expressed protein 49-like [Pomacea canaliculata]|uniref:testis-expressed protein 49-like n=1 Tax=Pomacea canaliculata TaxID=400727 RepID=UPI000D733825|nr:testis-expressed protein 49-like [Pomacea canaliculata]